MSKDFKNDNPALAFISVVESNREEIPDGYRLSPRYIETKSRRVALLVQPSVFSRLKKIATAKELSVNEAINEAIKLYLGGVEHE